MLAVTLYSRTTCWELDREQLDKIVDTHLPGKRSFHVVDTQFNIPLRHPYRFVERKANMINQWCPAKVELLTVTNTYYMG